MSGKKGRSGRPTNMDRDLIGFVDSRFPTEKWSKEFMVAIMWVKEHGETPTLTLESRLISNDKYAQYNDEY